MKPVIPDTLLRTPLHLALLRILRGVAAAFRKHGEFPTDPYEQFEILEEEVNEVEAELFHVTMDENGAKRRVRRGMINRERLDAEWCDVATVGVRRGERREKP